mgnify:CR=1 FL=1
MATPIRFSPKSKASRLPAWWSGVPNGSRQIEGVDPQHGEGRAEAVFGGNREQDIGIVQGHGEPGVRGQLCIELSLAPARIPQGHEHALWPTTLGGGLKDVARGSQANALQASRDHQSGTPLANGLVQNKAPVGLHGATDHDGHVLKCLAFEGQVDARKEAGQRHVGRPVENQAHGPLGVVLGDEDDRATEGWVGQRGHGHQQLASDAREIGGILGQMGLLCGLFHGMIVFVSPALTHGLILTSNSRKWLALNPNPLHPACQLVWLRRDLRLEDHAALAQALTHPEPLVLVFVFDREILQGLPAADRRVRFLHETLAELQQTLAQQGAGLLVVHDRARESIPRLARQLGAIRVICAEDYEPDAIARDQSVAESLLQQGSELVTVQDQCIFAKQQLLTGAGRPFSVFTPYKNAWLKAQTPQQSQARSTTGLARKLLPAASIQARLSSDQSWVTRLPSMAELGFEAPTEPLPDQSPMRAGPRAAEALLEDFSHRMGQYKEARDFPAKRGPSYLSVHLRFGTISLRDCVRRAQGLITADPSQSLGAQTWLSELIWRDFYFQILANFPHVVDRSFKPIYDQIRWVDQDDARYAPRWQAWCSGQTGYPLVDAGLRQLNQTGYMHNRLRMVVASFLTKDLGIHWLAGERYFALQLNDYDLSANNGGWQWAASTGCDAQPYFRIFNPVSQSEKFDPKGQFIRRYVPELAALSDQALHAPWLASPLELKAAGVVLGQTYPLPVVDHAQARAETLARFAVVKAQN